MKLEGNKKIIVNAPVMTEEMVRKIVIEELDMRLSVDENISITNETEIVNNVVNLNEKETK